MRTITRVSVASIDAFADVPDKVSGIAYSRSQKAVGFFCFSTGDVGFVSADGVRYVPRQSRLSCPIGCATRNGGIILLQLENDAVWRFDGGFNHGLAICGARATSEFNALVPATKMTAPVGMCELDSYVVAVAATHANRIVSIGPGGAEVMFGCGRKGFAMSSKLSAATLNSPSGVCWDRKSGMMFVADTGNGVIRRVLGGKEGIPIGVPGDLRQVDGAFTKARFLRPTVIKMAGDKLVVVDDKSVRSVDLGCGRVSTTYFSSMSVVDVDVGDDCSYVLESK